MVTISGNRCTRAAWMLAGLAGAAIAASAPRMFFSNMSWMSFALIWNPLTVPQAGSSSMVNARAWCAWAARSGIVPTAW